MIRQAIEGRINWLSGLQVSDLPYPLPKGINIHIQHNAVGLEVQGLVGALPLLNQDTLQIIPKIGRVNFLRLLFKAEGLQYDLEREYDEFVKYSVEDESNIDLIVARQLMISAAEIMSRSSMKGRVKRRRQGLFAFGTMETLDTVLNIAKHKQDPVVYFVRERTLNIPENRIITEAILRVWPLIDDISREKYRLVWEKWLGRFPKSDDIEADLRHVEQGFASSKYGGSRDYYRKTLMLSQIVLGSNGLGFRESATVQGDAVLLNTADIFEKYLRNVVNEAYSKAGYIITKGGIGTRSLYTDGSMKLEPDIVISRDGHVLLIMDAKYKEPTADDHYQLQTYLKVYGVNSGVLLAPRFVGSSVEIRKFSTADKITVREAYLPMSNLTATEDFLATVLEQFG